MGMGSVRLGFGCQARFLSVKYYLGVDQVLTAHCCSVV